MSRFSSKEQRQKYLATEHKRILKKYPDGIPLAELFPVLSQKASGFQTHPEAKQSEQEVQEFAEAHEIWLPLASPHTVHMGSEVHRSAEEKSLLTVIGKVYIILFYVDDTMSNDMQDGWSPEKREQVVSIVKNFLLSLENSKKNIQPTLLEKSMISVVEELREYVSPAWLRRFVALMKSHLALATTDQDSLTTGHALSLLSYFELRNEVSGMWPTLHMMSLASKNFLEESELFEHNLLSGIKILEYLCATIGGVVNDFFSFEKEVIDENNDFNVIPILMINDPNLSLLSAIYESAKVVNGMVKEFFEVADLTLKKCAQLDHEGVAIGNKAKRYVLDLVDGALATWHWQSETTERYLRDVSIFLETRQAHRKNLSSWRALANSDH